MIFKPICSLLHELTTVADKAIERFSLTLVTCSIYIANLANLDLTFMNRITSVRDPSIS